jgi:hypothetical protein
MLTRPLGRRHSADNVVPVPTPDSHQPGQLVRSSGGGLHLPRGNEPMTDMGNGIVMPAAQDPTDPHTWRVPVVFT